MRKFAFVAAAVAALSITAPSSAATQIVNGSGQLTGATGVNVDGKSYDVSFADGTCAALFGGCDSSSDFTFTTFNDAYDAAQALLDQVFIDSASGQFDSDPWLTFGCGDPESCLATIPYEASSGGFYANEAWNTTATDYNNVSLTAPTSFDSTGRLDHVYVLFSPSSAAVPEPSTWTMLLLGFLGLGAATRYQRKRQFGTS